MTPLRVLVCRVWVSFLYLDFPSFCLVYFYVFFRPLFAVQEFRFMVQTFPISQQCACRALRAHRCCDTLASVVGALWGSGSTFHGWRSWSAHKRYMLRSTEDEVIYNDPEFKSLRHRQTIHGAEEDVAGFRPCGMQVRAQMKASFVLALFCNMSSTNHVKPGAGISVHSKLSYLVTFFFFLSTKRHLIICQRAI